MPTKSRKPATAPRSGRIVRYAVVGQGYISQIAVLPSFENARKNSELAAIVSDDPLKLKKLSRKYDVEHTAGYDDFERCLEESGAEAVFIALPNHLHREFTERAARLGVHVLCEKPMAVTSGDCEAMIRTCKEQSVRLMIAYRLHFEEANMKAVEIVRSGRLGEPRIFNSVFTMQVTDPDNIRIRRETGGGTLYDIGIYCINASRYLFRDEPVEVQAVTASNGEKRFQEVEEMASAILRFPGERLASFTCSFGAADVSAYRIVGTEGSLLVEPAYEYAGSLKHRLTIGSRTTEKTFPKRDQFAPELLHFSDCVIEGRSPEPSGLEGLIDVGIIEALYRSAKSGEPEPFTRIDRSRRPGMKQEMKKPPVRKPKLVHATSPSGED